MAKVVPEQKPILRRLTYRKGDFIFIWAMETIIILLCLSTNLTVSSVFGKGKFVKLLVAFVLLLILRIQRLE